MRKKNLVIALVAALLLSNMPIASFATEAVETVQTKQQVQIGELPDEEEQSVEMEKPDEEDLTCNGSNLAKDGTNDAAEAQENVESVSGNGGQDEEENNEGEEQPSETLPGEEEILPPESGDAPKEEEVEIVQEHEDIVSVETTVSVGETGTYLPYVGAKYSLKYEVVDDGISIMGIADYVSKDDLGELVIPSEIEGVKVIEIFGFAFYGCSGFTGSLNIPDSIETIGSSAFNGCSGFTGSLHISNNVKGIGNLAFYNCSGFTGDLVIPEGIKGIWNYTFNGCSGFTGNLSIPDGLAVIDDYAFSGCSGLTGHLVIPDSVTTIGTSAFQNCSGLQGELNISDNVMTIGQYAFQNCSGFTGNLNIPDNITEIAQGAFSGCSGFTGRLNISGNVTEIAWGAFSGCSGFTGELNIPNSVTNIAGYAFSGCSGFTGSLNIPNSVTNIGEYAFSGCSGFTGNLNIPSNVTNIEGGVFNGCSGFTGELNIPNSVTNIAGYAFSGCSGFTGSLSIPNSVTNIGGYAFSGCSGFTGNLNIPNSVTGIGDYVFSGCSGFTGSLNIPDSVTKIARYAFENCNGFDGNLVIPDSVTEIGHYAFRGCSGFTGNLNIPNNVTNIWAGAFENCSGFDGELVIPGSITGISSGAFEGCSGFTGSLNIPNSVTDIGKYAFRGCSGFTGNLNIPNSVVTIADYAFENCSGFDGELIIGQGVKIIGPGAFMGCNKFAGRLFIPNNVAEIGDYAFISCNEDVIISASVEKIGKQAFGGGWRELKKITILGTKTVIEKDGLGESNFIWGHTGSTAEKYAIENKCFFISLDNAVPEITEYRVSNEQELIEAIGGKGEGSYRHIILSDGIYKVPDGICLSNVISLTIEAEHPGGAEILSENGYSPVIGIYQCMDINIAGCILGHKSVTESLCGWDGHVLYIQNSDDINVEDCDLYGCGITGIAGFVCGDINIINSIVRDCMACIVYSTSSIGNKLYFKDCIFSGNAYDKEYTASGAFVNEGTTSLENCTFINNHSTAFESPKAGEITLSNCYFHDNAWDGQSPKAYGVCLNGITWQVDGEILKIGYPLQLDADNVIESKLGKVLDYSEYSLPWKNYKNLKIDVAPGVEYGLPQAAAPVITQIGDRLNIKATEGCTIYYTTNGTVPTAATGIKADGSVVTLNSFSGTLRAIAVRPGYADSVVVSRNLINSDRNRNVVFDVNGVIGGRTVTFLYPEPSMKIYYSTTSSTITTRDKCVNAGQTVLFENFYGTVYARSYFNGEWGNVCRLILKIPVVNTPSISSDSKGNVTIRTSTPGSTIYYTTDGSIPTPSNGTRVVGTSATLSSFSGTLRAIAVRSCFTNSAVTSSNLINSEKTRNVAFTVKGVFGGRDVTFDCAIPGAKIYYSTTTSKITTKDNCVNAGETVRFEDFYGTIYARSYCNGKWGNVCRLILKIPVVGTPTITVDSQGYATIQTATPGCYLYYTTDGSTPTMTNGRRVTASRTRVYVGKGVTVKAIAVRSCFTNSEVAVKK